MVVDLALKVFRAEKSGGKERMFQEIEMYFLILK